jgi:hypothetical protein
MVVKVGWLKDDVIAMAIYPFIFVNKRKVIDESVIRHEKIHLRQEIEMLVVPFYIWYLVEYWIRWIALSSSDAAYRAISFEREAYANDDSVDYLKRRPFWAFLKYLKKNVA